ncbi:MAG TPA: DUF4260 domain-containing protein, partial [Terracidiphilus sp.]|nr:DUF4260 domain-containing protein [Terracidiphilus sp.]
MARKTEVLTGPGGVGPGGVGPGGVGRGSIRALLRMEGLVAAAVTALLYARTGVSWWLFAGLWLVPDLSMLGYLAGSCRGAKIYNVAHTYVLPAVLGLIAFGLHQHVLLAAALVWANHIGVDRALGYGLKYGEGFGWT